MLDGTYMYVGNKDQRILHSDSHAYRGPCSPEHQRLKLHFDHLLPHQFEWSPEGRPKLLRRSIPPGPTKDLDKLTDDGIFQNSPIGLSMISVSVHTRRQESPSPAYQWDLTIMQALGSLARPWAGYSAVRTVGFRGFGNLWPCARL